MSKGTERRTKNMKRYGLLTSLIERKTNKTVKVYKPRYSDNLKELKTIEENIYNVLNYDSPYRVEIKIFDYLNAKYVG